MPGSTSKPARTSRGNLLRAIFVLGLLVFIGWLVTQMLPPRVLQNPVATPPIPNPATNSPPELEPTTAAAPPGAEVAQDPVESPAIRKVLRESVCEIVGSGPEGNRTLGAGVIVDPRGIVLTCLHVVAETTEPSVRLASGATLEVSGYRQLDPLLDLVLLVVKDSPELKAVTWKTLDPAHGTPIAAAGHPRGASYSLAGGKIQQQMSTLELPPEERAFVKRLLTSSGIAPDDLPTGKLWLQHSAPLQQGYSGGPLLDRAGNAVGLNVWINETAQRSYAVDGAEVQKLLNLPPLDPLLRPARLASLDARWRATQWEMSGDKLQIVFDQARSMRWQPATQDDYRILQQLALGLNIARDDELLAASGRTARHVEDFVKSSQPVMIALDKQRWRDAGQLILINEFASLALEEVNSGFFAFVQVEQVIAVGDKQLTVLCELAGGDEKLIARIDKSLSPPEPGDQWVMLGVQQRDRLLWEGEVLPTISSHVVLPLD